MVDRRGDLHDVLPVDEHGRLRARLRGWTLQERGLHRTAQLPGGLGPLHVRDDVIRRQRDHPRRRDRLRPDHPFDEDQQARLPAGPVPRRLRDRGAPHAARAGGHGARIADAVGRPRQPRPQPARRPSLCLFPDRAAEPLHPLRGLLRSGDDHPLDHGDLPRRHRLRLRFLHPGGCLSGSAAAPDGDRDRGAVRIARPQRRRSLLDGARAERDAARSRRGPALQPVAVDRRRHRLSGCRVCRLSLRRPRDVQARAEEAEAGAASVRLRLQAHDIHSITQPPARQCGAARTGVDAHEVRSQAGDPEPGLSRPAGLGPVHDHLRPAHPALPRLPTHLPDDALADSRDRGCLPGDHDGRRRLLRG